MVLSEEAQAQISRPDPALVKSNHGSLRMMAASLRQLSPSKAVILISGSLTLVPRSKYQNEPMPR